MGNIASCGSDRTVYPAMLDAADLDESLMNREGRAASAHNRVDGFGASEAFGHFRRALDGAGEGVSGYVAEVIPGEGDACAGLRVETSGGFFGSFVHLCKKLVSWIFDGDANRQIRTLFRNAVEGVLARFPGDGGQHIRKQLDTIVKPASGWPLDLRDVRRITQACDRLRLPPSNAAAAMTIEEFVDDDMPPLVDYSVADPDAQEAPAEPTPFVRFAQGTYGRMLGAAAGGQADLFIEGVPRIPLAVGRNNSNSELAGWQHRDAGSDADSSEGEGL